MTEPFRFAPPTQLQAEWAEIVALYQRWVDLDRAVTPIEQLMAVHDTWQREEQAFRERWPPEQVHQVDIVEPMCWHVRTRSTPTSPS